MKTINDKWLYFPIVILFIYFIYRLIDQSQIIYYFPFDYINDVSSYMAQLHFLKVCGFHNYCPYWYNGFIAFNFTSPALFFFALPFYYLFGDVKIALYTTTIISFILGFLFIYFLGNKLSLSKMQRIAFFIFFFGTANSIGNFIRLGRAHELFAWVWFIPFAFLMIHYMNKNLDRYSLFIIPLYSLVIFSYLSVGVLASLLFLGLFLVKNKKEKLYVILYFIASLLLISFWFIPFALNVFKSSSIPSMLQGNWILDFSTNLLFSHIAIFLLPIIFFTLFYFYWRSVNKDKKVLYFYSPVLILSLILFLRLIPFVPVFRNIFPDPYITFFLFFSILFFLGIDYRLFVRLSKFIPFLLIILSLISISVNLIHTPNFVIPDKNLKFDLDGLFSEFNGSFLLYGNYPITLYEKAVYSYAPIYYNLSTPFGWYPEVKDPNYIKKFSEIDLTNCDNFKRDLKYFNTTHVIGYTDFCDKINSCSFKFIDKRNDFCLYKIN